ncbi:MAG: Holliday junction branch migration protein RuvA [Deltaproteobacteria bacterium]|nr:Holliday junction branch migration protein RuvA [Deltaproteobacteria bacterium]
MIERVFGQCVMKQGSTVIIDVNGVGYGVEVTDATAAQLHEDTAALLWIYTHVREDSLRLFGFPELSERQLFSQLLSVSGVGPKVAMAILATISASDLVRAVEEDDASILEEVPGIGPRQSKKIILELKPKVAKISAFCLTQQTGKTRSPATAPLFDARSSRLAADTIRDLRSALENFGYKDKEIQPIVRKLERDPPATDLATLLKSALADLASASPSAIGRGEELF